MIPWVIVGGVIWYAADKSTRRTARKAVRRVARKGYKSIKQAWNT